MPVPPDRSSDSHRTPNRAYATEAQQLVGQWRHTAESYGLTRQLNPRRPEDAALAADPRRDGYEQAVAVIAATLAAVPTLEALMQRYYYDPSSYPSLDASDATPRKRRARDRLTFRDLLIDTCARCSPDDHPLVQHVVLAAA